MKNRIITLGLLITLVVAFATCKKDFLDTAPISSFTSTATWKDASLSQAFIYNVYSFLGFGGFEEQMLASYSDEAVFTHPGRNIKTFNEGSESPSNLAWTSTTYSWDKMYQAIREANIAISKLPTAGFVDGTSTTKNLRDQMLGEAYFLRAYYYHQLLRYYGGVPLITKTYGINDNYEVVRSPFGDCVNFIVHDLDSAALLLTGKPLTPGRTSQLAALALKARVLLYAASDLHDLAKASANAKIIGDFSNKELLCYTTGDRQARWKLAQDAAKAVLDAGSGYQLGLSAPVSTGVGTQNYTAIAMGGGSKVADASAAVELIFQRTQSAISNDGGVYHAMQNGPNGYHNWAGNTPLQQMVDDYEMMDGTKFDWTDTKKAAAPYTNRDPRFYASILYDGSNWKPRPADVAAADPANQIQTGYYDDGKGGTISGLDTRQSSIENWNGGFTHYYAKKFMDPDPALPVNTTTPQLVPWPFIRYTEAVLSYAEASIELGQESEAIRWLNKIRFRAGMPATTASGDALRQLCRNERRIELMYEEHRYHDARRWMIAPTTLGSGVKVPNIKGVLKQGATALNPYRYDPTVYNYSYTVSENTERENRKWFDKMYYRPIARNEKKRNSKLIQNPGYLE